MDRRTTRLDRGGRRSQRHGEVAGVNSMFLSVFMTCAVFMIRASADSSSTPGPIPGFYDPMKDMSTPTSPESIIPSSTNRSVQSNSSDNILPMTVSLPENVTPTTEVPITRPPLTDPPKNTLSMVVGNLTTRSPTSSNQTTSLPTRSTPTTSLPTSSNRTTSLPTISTPTTSLPTTTTHTTRLPIKGFQTQGLQAAMSNTTGPRIATSPATNRTTVQQAITVPQTSSDIKTTSSTLSKIPTKLTTTYVSSKTHSPHENTTIPTNVQPSQKTDTSKGNENVTEAPKQTTHVNATQNWNQTIKVTDVGSISGSSSTSSPATSILIETSVIYVTDNVPADITAGKETTPLLTHNVTTTVNGTGLNPAHEKDDLKMLLLIIGVSVGGAVTLIILVFIVVYRVAKKRSKETSSRYYNFKKKASRPNYEKVLHLQEYCGDLDTDIASTAGTGAAWVFQENDQDAGKTITLEFTPKDKNKPANKSSKPKNRNKNKNNKNKSTSRGNYQVLAEMFPTRNIPPDVLLSAEGATHSNSEDDEAEHETSFGTMTRNDDNKLHGPVVTDGLASKNSFNDGASPIWPTWNTSPYVKITQDEAVVEL